MWRVQDLLWKVRSSRTDVDRATFASIAHSVPTVKLEDWMTDRPAPTTANATTPPVQPVAPAAAPNEANVAHAPAPNEPNSPVQASSCGRPEGQKEVGIDQPHVVDKSGGTGITGNLPSHPVLERVLRGKKSTLLDLSTILGKP
jgi:hypothetical protein